MSAKYYTQFRLTDAYYRGGNEFSGVVELSRPMDKDSDVSDIEAVLAKNFDLQQSAVKLVSWSRLHSFFWLQFPPDLPGQWPGFFLMAIDSGPVPELGHPPL